MCAPSPFLFFPWDFPWPVVTHPPNSSLPTSPFARIGIILRHLRTAQGLSRPELAQRAGVEAALIRTIEESQETPDVNLSDLDAVLGDFGIQLRDLSAADWKLRSDMRLDAEGREIVEFDEDREAELEDIEGREMELLVLTIERLQARVTTLEDQLKQRDSASMRSLQKESIKLLERAMEASGMTQEDMRRLVDNLVAQAQ